MKRKHRFRSWRGIIYLDTECKFLWVGRFMYIWGWNGKKNVHSLSFYTSDLETCIWTIGES